MRAAGCFSLIAISAVAALGCGTDPAGAEPTPLVGFCAGGGTASANGTALLSRAPGSFRTECLNGVYENTGTAAGGDFYYNAYVSRMEIRETPALAAIRCTFSGPLSNPPNERDNRDVTAMVNVVLKVNDWGVEFVGGASDSKKDPYYISSCATELPAARWPFCVERPNAPGVAEPPEGETFCVHIDSAGLQSVSVAGVGGSSSYKLIAKKIGD
jgi:hypothetical protein